jgi:hypothetical protein
LGSEAPVLTRIDGVQAGPRKNPIALDQANKQIEQKLALVGHQYRQHPSPANV